MRKNQATVIDETELMGCERGDRLRQGLVEKDGGFRVARNPAAHRPGWHRWPSSGIIWAACGVVGLLMLVGCVTVPQPSLAAFSTGLTTAKTQTDLAFQSVNSLTATEVVDYAASQPKLTDDLVFSVLPASSIAVWDRMFDVLEKYSQDLILLTSPGLTKDYETAMVDLAQQIQQTGQNLKAAGIVANAPSASPGVATAVTEVGRLLLEAKAQSDARKILSATDPSIRTILNSMADVIGGTSQTGIRGTVFANWTNVKIQVKDKFSKEMDVAKKRALVLEFISYQNQADAQDQVLASLYRSLRALADAHHALAAGKDLDASVAVAIVKEEITETRDLYKQFQANSKP